MSNLSISNPPEKATSLAEHQDSFSSQNGYVETEAQDPLNPAHRAMLEQESGLSPDVIAARGYFSATKKTQLKELGFSEVQCRVPALVIPVHGVDGEIRLYQIRPDSPRSSSNGKPIKYETPAGARLAVDVPPFVRPELAKLQPALFISEGVKKADSAASHGLCCIDLLGVWGFRGTHGEGAKTALPDWELIHLEEREVYIVFDSDVMEKLAVQAALARLKAFLEMRKARVRLIYLEPRPDGGKVGLDDFFAAGHTVGELTARATDTLRPDVVQSPPAEPSWPVLAAEALHGLAGDIVRTIDPHTEADPVATLLNVLTAFGNCINATAHAKVQHDRHPARLFVVQVGDTSKGRKGTGWSTPRYLFSQADPDWAETRIKSGLSSGEGLIYQVRDPVYSKVPVKEKGRFTGEYDEICTDEGEDDKRLLVVEPEFASVLTVADREKNTLSAILRQAWDGHTLSPMTKNSRIQATGAHISTLGHITRQELLARLDDTSKANGFANRFLWALVKRSKELPEGGAVPDAELALLVERLKEAITFARTVSEVRRDEEARQLWAAVYHDLSEGKPGLVGAVLSRAEAQVLRLSLPYALLDCSDVVRVEHLRAGLAIWEYCERSALLIFGKSLGDPTADRILEALRNAGSAGMSDNDIRELFGRHKSADERARALHMLEQLGLVIRNREDTGGRPRTIWQAAR